MDYEGAERNFELVVRVYETDEGPLASHDLYFTVIVTVVPAQDGKPVWTTTTYTATVASDIAFGSLVTPNPSSFDYTDPDGYLATDPDNPHAYGSMAVTQCQCGMFTIAVSLQKHYIFQSIIILKRSLEASYY